LWAVKCCNSLICITFPTIFEKGVKTDIGRQLDLSFSLPFLNTGIIIAYFNLSGKTPV